MALTKQERDTATFAVTQLIGIFLLIATLAIPLRTKNVVLSPRFVPLIVVVIFNLISLYSLIRSVAGGGTLRPAALLGAVGSALKTKEIQRTLFTILAICLYVFVGVPLAGYYISSLLLMLAVIVFYLKRPRTVWYVVAIVVFVAALYAVFALLFRIPLR